MSMVRFTGLTNEFSKKVENHCHGLALYFVFCNFVRRHQTLRISPTMAAGISDGLWSIDDIAALIDADESGPKKRGPTSRANRLRFQSESSPDSPTCFSRRIALHNVAKLWKHDRRAGRRGNRKCKQITSSSAPARPAACSPTG
jgi:hypothetical protein